MRENELTSEIKIPPKRQHTPESPTMGLSARIVNLKEAIDMQIPYFTKLPVDNERREAFTKIIGDLNELMDKNGETLLQQEIEERLSDLEHRFKNFLQ
ncbi:MAG: hypothetical protein Q8Q39_01735 [bacterium]|nr:hypothetical protein [bacterium]